jgi:hypothetical protein
MTIPGDHVERSLLVIGPLDVDDLQQVVAAHSGNLASVAWIASSGPRIRCLSILYHAFQLESHGRRITPVPNLTQRDDVVH